MAAAVAVRRFPSELGPAKLDEKRLENFGVEINIKKIR
jgi:hypothetical protein